MQHLALEQVVLCAQAADPSEDILTQMEKLHEKLEKKLEHSNEKLEKKLEPLWEAIFVPVAKSVRTVETDVEVRQACVEHHGRVKECLILRHLHKESATWYSNNICTAHIYNKDHDAPAQTMGFEVNDPKNTLLLLRHFELEFDRGRLMLMPVEVGQAAEEPLSLVLKVYIHDELKAENV